MKKAMIIAALALTFAACGSGESTEQVTTDSTTAAWAKSTSKKDWRGKSKTQIPGGKFVQVIYAKAPTVLSSEDDIYETVTGLPSSTIDVIVYGTIARLIVGSDAAPNAEPRVNPDR